MLHSPLPLKPHQCLVLTRSKALFATAGTLWIDNIYFASIDPLGSSGRHNLFLSTNYPHTVRDTSNAFVGNPAAASEDCTTVRDLRVFLTDVVMHGRPAGGSQTLSLAPINTHMSVALLAQGTPPNTPLCVSMHVRQRPYAYSNASEQAYMHAAHHCHQRCLEHLNKEVSQQSKLSASPDQSARRSTASTSSAQRSVLVSSGRRTWQKLTPSSRRRHGSACPHGL